MNLLRTNKIKYRIVDLLVFAEIVIVCLMIILSDGSLVNVKLCMSFTATHWLWAGGDYIKKSILSAHEMLFSLFCFDSSTLLTVRRGFHVHHYFAQKILWIAPLSKWKKAIKEWLWMFFLPSWKYQVAITKNKTMQYAVAVFKWRAKCCADFFARFSALLQSKTCKRIYSNKHRHSNHPSQELGKTFCYLSMQFGFLLNSSFRLLLSF